LSKSPLVASQLLAAASPPQTRRRRTARRRGRCFRGRRPRRVGVCTRGCCSPRTASPCGVRTAKATAPLPSSGPPLPSYRTAVPKALEEGRAGGGEAGCEPASWSLVRLVELREKIERLSSNFLDKRCLMFSFSILFYFSS
jgi:hypothetical protein